MFLFFLFSLNEIQSVLSLQVLTSIVTIIELIIFAEYDVVFALLVPVDDDEEEDHAQQAVNDLTNSQRVSQHLIELVVVDGVRGDFLVLILEYSLETAVENHGERSMGVDIRTVPLEVVEGVGQPHSTLVLQLLFVTA